MNVQDFRVLREANPLPQRLLPWMSLVVLFMTDLSAKEIGALMPACVHGIEKAYRKCLLNE